MYKRQVFDTKLKTADENDIYSYGFAFTSSDLDAAVKALSDIMPYMLRLAEVEKSCQLMSAEIEKTRRRVNAVSYTHLGVNFLDGGFGQITQTVYMCVVYHDGVKVY